MKPQSETNVVLNGIFEDNRIDANIKRDGSTIQYPDGTEYISNSETWESGGIVEGAGVDTTTHESSDIGKDEINKVDYTSTYLSKQQFIDEGWITDVNRRKEQEYLALMDSSEIKGSNKSVRNLKTGREFAERFIAAYKLKNNDSSNYNVDMLAGAIMAANPSLFDINTGNMYRNADFSRLNLPTNLDRFKIEDITVPAPTPAPTPVPTPTPTPIGTKPVIKDRGLSDEEIEQYIKADDNYIARFNYRADIDLKMKEIETKYNFTRGDTQQEIGAQLNASINNKDFDDYFQMKFFMKAYGDKFEESFKQTLANWVDTPKDADVSKFFFRRNSLTLTNVRKETLPDGTKVYNTAQGYYNLYFDGKPGKLMTEEELKKHGWTKPE